MREANRNLNSLNDDQRAKIDQLDTRVDSLEEQVKQIAVLETKNSGLKDKITDLQA